MISLRCLLLVISERVCLDHTDWVRIGIFSRCKLEPTCHASLRKKRFPPREYFYLHLYAEMKLRMYPERPELLPAREFAQ